MNSRDFRPEETFFENGITTDITVLDFWRFAYSDLNADPRDDVAEFLVSRALGLKMATNRQDWTLFDIMYKGIRVEVKCSGYFQTWREEGTYTTERRFSIKQSIDRHTDICTRHNDVYVFCLLNGTTREEADPLNLDNWDFFVIPTTVINAECGDNQSITLKRIKNMGYERVSFSNLKDAINMATKELQPLRIRERMAQLKNRMQELTYGPDENFDVDEFDRIVKEVKELMPMMGDKNDRNYN